MAGVCFWNYCDGDCVYQTQSLIASLRSHGVDNDFICLSDRDVVGATRTIRITLDTHAKQLCKFKFRLLPELAHLTQYEHFVWLDSDSLCVAPLHFDLRKLCAYSPLHIFLETDLSIVPEASWYYIRNNSLVRFFNQKGIVGPIHNCNGGFIMVERKCIPMLYDIATRFWQECHQIGVELMDEVVLDYVTHLVSRNFESHKITNVRNVWLTDWTYKSDKLPPPDQQWQFTDWFTGWKTPMQPSIVHLLASKQPLTAAGKLLG